MSLGLTVIVAMVSSTFLIMLISELQHLNKSVRRLERDIAHLYYLQNHDRPDEE